MRNKIKEYLPQIIMGGICYIVIVMICIHCVIAAPEATLIEQIYLGMEHFAEGPFNIAGASQYIGSIIKMVLTVTVVGGIVIAYIVFGTEGRKTEDSKTAKGSDKWNDDIAGFADKYSNK